jgi:hypothetical protein
MRNAIRLSNSQQGSNNRPRSKPAPAHTSGFSRDAPAPDQHKKIVASGFKAEWLVNPATKRQLVPSHRGSGHDRLFGVKFMPDAPRHNAKLHRG